MLFVKPVMVAFLVVGMTTFISGSLLAQDTVTSKSRKVIKVKVDTDENGESFTIDTSFIIDEHFSMEQFHDAMKDYEVQMKEMGNCLQEAYRDMPGKRKFQRSFRHPRLLEYLREPGHIQFSRMPHECCKTVHVNPGKKGESLSDVLGDIPMSAVKSYKIRETKNGKRITIEISDDPLLGPPNRDILIWHREMPDPRPRPGIKREIILDRDVMVREQEEVEEPAEPEQPK
ncbi:MAG: hypothetical protein ABIJ04_10015 [Bacteroidota bacterium]